VSLGRARHQNSAQAGRTANVRGEAEHAPGRDEARLARQDEEGLGRVDLLSQALAHANMVKAWQRVKANRGSAGVDGLSIAATGEYLKRAWPRIKEELRSGRRSKDLLSPAEREALIEYLARHPKAGDLIQEIGGVRKLRWARRGRGKSGGLRVIYYFHSDRIPLYLLTLFAKGERANLSVEERHALADLTAALERSAKVTT